jgi:hypothetical protein
LNDKENEKNMLVENRKEKMSQLNRDIQETQALLAKTEQHVGFKRCFVFFYFDFLENTN